MQETIVPKSANTQRQRVSSKSIMEKLCLILFLLSPVFLLAQKNPPKKKPPVKYWEEFTQAEKNAVIKDSIVSKYVSDLYNDKFSFADPKTSAELFNVLISPGGAIVALRLYLMNELVASNDTSITKMLNEYTVKMAYNQPDMLFRYFTFEHLKKKDVYKNYIPFFAADLDERVEYANFKQFLDLYFFNANAMIKQMLSLVYKGSEKAGAGSNDPVPVPLPPKGKDD